MLMFLISFGSKILSLYHNIFNSIKVTIITLPGCRHFLECSFYVIFFFCHQNIYITTRQSDINCCFIHFWSLSRTRTRDQHHKISLQQSNRPNVMIAVQKPEIIRNKRIKERQVKNQQGCRTITHIRSSLFFVEVVIRSILKYTPH